MATPLYRVPLHFDRAADGISDPERLREGLSAVERTGDYLWLACDETPTIERLTLRPDGSFGGHVTFALADYVDLPDDGEVDVEGMAYAAPYLWVVGSHSRKRNKAKEGDDDQACIDRIARVETDASRYFLARIPLANDDELGLVPCARRPDPEDPDRELTAARLRGRGPKGGIVRELRDDEHLRPFLRIPGKDNGFDVEGLAVMGERVFIGLRGPVLRGWAIILELEPVAERDRADRLRLRKIGEDGERYRKHFLELEGMGIRDLRRDGDDLLVLAGTTLSDEAPMSLWRWPGGASPDLPSLVRGNELRRVLDLPFTRGQRDDHAEAVALYDGLQQPAVMVLYDSAAQDRLFPNGVYTDVFELRG
ncbi:MAG: hypothetical protein AVDCRST_MAG68-1712 [uncultured Gemmatimonadetes bacterium]|uniref:DUF3616 domain-containing protein n=1 Tax=uncultured Gemmatimonadota bacterium TaxID=203437 RepID=A0A6J4K301_9BACT|nr:MAG: hypothetical protein AVDCRST_MAG68-1712 [uncultured Gemmatimonadota bacterium]